MLQIDKFLDIIMSSTKKGQLKWKSFTEADNDFSQIYYAEKNDTKLIIRCDYMVYNNDYVKASLNLDSSPLRRYKLISINKKADWSFHLVDNEDCITYSTNPFRLLDLFLQVEDVVIKSHSKSVVGKFMDYPKKLPVHKTEEEINNFIKDLEKE